MIWKPLTTAGLALCLVSGCGTPQPPPPGHAASKVTVVRGDVTYPVTAEIVRWEVKKHPQTPQRGVAVFFDYKFTGAQPTRIEVQVCAVDEHRVVLLCGNIGLPTPGTIEPPFGDDWLGPDEADGRMGLQRTSEVLVVPDQMYAGPHAGDPKDGDGYVPPKLLGPGDQL
ncbi:hypothetical protein [Kutzneria sp. 744]|uniref:hypothetical protein n=1 Tax=Kutzneria sp. (strain 744) TaxID=345341 RepID=UPI0003EEA64A|nr:hypothetical protein [Kutzneria sp. 744]EWM18503.1 hypothetical protein KUTG_08807 [Kutzneria sp. 744]